MPISIRDDSKFRTLKDIKEIKVVSKKGNSTLSHFVNVDLDEIRITGDTLIITMAKRNDNN